MKEAAQVCQDDQSGKIIPITFTAGREKTTEHSELVIKRLSISIFALLLFALSIVPAVRAKEPGKERLVPEIRFVIPSAAYDTARFESGMLIAKNWEKLGAKVKVITIPDWAAFAKLVDHPWENDAFIAAYIGNPGRIDPDELLTRPFHSSFIQKGGSNFAGYNNPEYDKVVDASKVELDPEKRKKLVFRAQEILARDIPHITLFHKKGVNVYNNKRWKDVVPSLVGGLFNVWNILKATPLTDDATMKICNQGIERFGGPMYAPSYTSVLEIQNLIYDSLTKVSPDGQAVPWAAEKWNAVNNTTIDVTLRPGMKFHDGKPVTAEDVKFSYDYISKWKVPLFVPELEPIKEIKVVDARTVRFSLKRPHAPVFLSVFSVIPIIPKHVWENVTEKFKLVNPTDWQNPDYTGSGPFKFVHYRPGEEMKLDRNDDHFMKPKAKSLVYVWVATYDTLFLSFKKGIIDFHTGRGLTSAQTVEAATIPHLGKLEIPDISVFWFQFNLRENSPFRDHVMRHAFAHAFDYNTIVNSILYGQAEPGRGIIAPANKYWHNFDIPSKEVGDDKPHYHQLDLAKARAILKDGGYEWDSEGRLYYPEKYQPKAISGTSK
jgi:peptide/nickel transport system substrate-binding protein